jgi:hypothetical protein
MASNRERSHGGVAIGGRFMIGCAAGFSPITPTEALILKHEYSLKDQFEILLWISFFDNNQMMNCYK